MGYVSPQIEKTYEDQDDLREPADDRPRALQGLLRGPGFTNNAQFSDENSACMVWSEAISVMLLTLAKWRGFTSRPIPPASSSEVMLAISCDSREAVDRMNDVAATHGRTADINPKQDLGFLYNRNLGDPDGHV
jgi:uncharacterized protein